MNALRHGRRGRACLSRARRIRNAIRLCAHTVLLARMLMRERDGRPSPLASPSVRRLRWPGALEEKQASRRNADGGNGG
jgi:hypothetical protein